MEMTAEEFCGHMEQVSHLPQEVQLVFASYLYGVLSRSGVSTKLICILLSVTLPMVDWDEVLVMHQAVPVHADRHTGWLEYTKMVSEIDWTAVEASARVTEQGTAFEAYGRGKCVTAGETMKMLQKFSL